ncbi:hypothetical protein GQ607_008287 [Colletotrichum asianum]|uniref:Uncharacterized protein n=1 Tax=Colletotrichum asianum TaxID=702518 RepID=A0A8H3WAV4_9PEZI|nr:hypothetical protein GQ607_008287 [Colletotrichum asianum]
MCVRVKREERMTAGGGKAFGNKGRGDKKAETTHHHPGWASIFSMLWGHGVGKSNLRIFLFCCSVTCQSCTLAPSGQRRNIFLASFFWVSISFFLGLW